MVVYAVYGVLWVLGRHGYDGWDRWAFYDCCGSIKQYYIFSVICITYYVKLNKLLRS